jgi:hypothetical protein
MCALPCLFFLINYYSLKKKKILTANTSYWPVVEVYEGGPADNFQGNSNAREGSASNSIVTASPSPMIQSVKLGRIIL